MAIDTTNETVQVAEPEWITAIDHRENVIAEIIAEAIDHDRQIARTERAIGQRLGGGSRDGTFGSFPSEILVPKPVQLVDAVMLSSRACAQLASRLYPHVAELVDKALDLDPAWTWDRAPRERQLELLARFFTDAVIPERFFSSGVPADD